MTFGNIKHKSPEENEEVDDSTLEEDTLTKVPPSPENLLDFPETNETPH